MYPPDISKNKDGEIEFKGLTSSEHIDVALTLLSESYILGLTEKQYKDILGHLKHAKTANSYQIIITTEEVKSSARKFNPIEGKKFEIRDDNSATGWKEVCYADYLFYPDSHRRILNYIPKEDKIIYPEFTNNDNL